MNRELLHKLNSQYTKEGLDFMKAIRVWKKARFSSEDIKTQVATDVGSRISSIEAKELQHLGAVAEHDYNAIAQQFEVSEGRSDLIPENIKENKIKLSPGTKQSMEKIGQNLYRHKTAGTYWTLKEKQGDNGESAIYLVAVEEPEGAQKIAEED